MIEEIENIDRIVDLSIEDLSDHGNLSVSGVWISESGSQVILRQRGSYILGTFTRKGGTAHRLLGSIVPQHSGQVGIALSFSVAWPSNNDPKYRSVTSYTGQYHPDKGFISTVFLLADETLPNKDYAAVSVGTDIFKRM